MALLDGSLPVKATGLALCVIVGLLMLANPVEVIGDRMVIRSASGYQTVSLLDGGRTGLYYDHAEAIGVLHPETKKVVLLGLGGGEMLRAARRTLPDAELIGVELSPYIAEVARSQFHVGDFGVKVVVDDAGAYVAKMAPQSTDALLVDVYNDTEIPAYFQSLPFFRLCHMALSPKGLLMMNVFPAELAQTLEVVMKLSGFSAVHRVPAGPNVVLTAER